MGRSFIAMASAVLGGCLLFPLAVAAQTAPLLPEPVGHLASLAPGSIAGVVHDEHGEPVAGALVSAVGSTPSFGLSDHAGRFLLKRLSPGPYLLRARLTGFVNSRGQFVDVRPSGRTDSSVALHRTASTEPTRPVLAAGAALPPAADPEPEAPPADDVVSTDGDENGSAWRIRHARRSVLREASVPREFIEDDSPARPGIGVLGSIGTSARTAVNLLAGTPFSGQFNLLTVGSLDTTVQPVGENMFATGIAYAALGAPAGSKADWAVSAALGQGEIGSWVVAGSYAVREPARHRYSLGVSYAAQRYNTPNLAALVSLADAGRSAGSMYGFDTFVVSPAVSVTYGARFDRYDYLANGGLMSPRAGVTIAPVGSHFRITALVSRRALAPGAEEFLQAADSRLWLPSQRTFASLAADTPARAEFTNHFEVGFEQDVARGTTLQLRVFRQRIANQLVALFGMEPGSAVADLGHYFAANGGNSSTTGWSAGIRTGLGEHVHGAVAYSLVGANWGSTGTPAYLLLVAPSAVRSNYDRIHDVSTSVETDLPETATRVAVLCRISNGFAKQQTDGPALDARFDVQVRQSLPFMNFSGARWEALFAIRNFFRDTASDQSVYDELLVIHPPKRVVGGLTLRF